MDFCKGFYLRRVMKADLRISIKDYHRNKGLRIRLFRPPHPCRQFLARMNAARWPAIGGLVALTRLLTARRINHVPAEKQNVSWLKGRLVFLQWQIKIDFFLSLHSFLRDGSNQKS